MALHPGIAEQGADERDRNASLVKQVVFPTEVLPVKSVIASLVTQLVSLAILVIYVLGSHGSLPLTYLLLPVALLIQVTQVIGLALMLAALGVYLRDLKDLVQVGTLVSMYLLPVFYLPAMVPSLFRPLLYLNPFSYTVWIYQDLCYFGRIEHPVAWIVASVLSLAFLHQRLARLPTAEADVRKCAVSSPPRRILHLGNILNNGYLNAKFLRRRGWAADSVTIDYRHVQAQPEWEEVPVINPALSHFDPDWSGIALGDYQRVPWFHDVALADVDRLADQIARGLPSGRGGDLLPAGAAPAPADMPRASPGGLLSRLGLFGVGRAVWKRAQHLDDNLTGEGIADRLVADFAAAYPARADKLSAQDVLEFKARSLAHRPLFALYPSCRPTRSIRSTC